MTLFDEGFYKIETERLVLELPSEDKVLSAVNSINDLEISQWLLSVSYPHTIEDSLRYIAHTRAEQGGELRKEYDYWMSLAGSDEVIGGIGLHDVNRVQGTSTVGYFVGKDYWRNGYGSEALSAIIELGFDQLQLRRIEAQVFEGNDASITLLEKLGFEQEGFQREAVVCRADSKIKNAYVYGLLRAKD